MSSSQQQPASQPTENNPDETMMEAPDSPPFEKSSPAMAFINLSGSTISNRINGGDNTGKINFGAPGSSYQTKKFNDEYDKMESQLLDKQWEPKYGDPLLPNRGH